jgi:hypothetical protein
MLPNADANWGLRAAHARIVAPAQGLDFILPSLQEATQPAKRMTCRAESPHHTRLTFWVAA